MRSTAGARRAAVETMAAPSAERAIADETSVREIISTSESVEPKLTEGKCFGPELSSVRERLILCAGISARCRGLPYTDWRCARGELARWVVLDVHGSTTPVGEPTLRQQPRHFPLHRDHHPGDPTVAAAEPGLERRRLASAVHITVAGHRHADNLARGGEVKIGGHGCCAVGERRAGGGVIHRRHDTPAVGNS